MKSNVIAILCWLLAATAFASDPYSVDYPLDQPVALGLAKEGTGTTSTADNSGNGHTWTLHNTEEGDWVTGPGGISYALNLDGVDEALIASDSDDFSFTTGSADEPFSIAVCANLTALTYEPLLSKIYSTASSEYMFYIKDYHLRLILYGGGDVSSHVATQSDGLISSYAGVWALFTATYDGSEASGGMSLYINSSAITTSDLSGGGYSHMSNTTSEVYVGAGIVADVNGAWAAGKFAWWTIIDKELTAEEVAGLSTICRQ